MHLEQLLASLTSVAGIGPVEQNNAAGASTTVIDDVVHDSRQAGDGTLFCAVPGLTVDGHDFVAAAANSGSPAALVERFVDAPCAQVKVPSVRRAMPYAAAAVHGQPSNDVAVFGITGTNGKTTTTQLFASIAASAGKSCSTIGTLEGRHTTPESPVLQRQLRGFVNDGADLVALEVSSHALDQSRVDATSFAVAAFTNLTPDHLNYHGDMESYFLAKKRLFDGRAKVELVNVDDPWGARLASERSAATPVSLNDVEIQNESIDGTSFAWRGHDVHVALPGRMNVANALMAAEAALHIGIEESLVAAGIAGSAVIPGRMERVTVEGGPTVFVDYSHTPDSIERALATVRRVAGGGKITIVFGCGGDRDRAKRPLMGRAAEAGADIVYVTSDNPRSEEPMAIIEDALAGLSAPEAAIVDPDRRSAIERAIIASGPEDVVLVAGKGHEKTQTIGSEALPFDDVIVARETLERAAS